MSLDYPLDILDRDTLDALEGTSGEPSETNKFVTEVDPRLGGAVASDQSPADSTAGAASPGSSPKVSRDDHKHRVATAAPVAIGSANTAGVSAALSRADHVHAHGSHSDPADHAIATTSAAGFMSASDKQDLNTILAAGGGAVAANKYDLYTSTLETTHTSYQTYHTWNTDNFDAGTYIVRWMFNFTTTRYNVPIYLDLRLDGSAFMNYIMAPAYDGTESIGAIGINQATFATNGTHTFEVRIKSGQNGRWVRLYSSYLELIKVV